MSRTRLALIALAGLALAGAGIAAGWATGGAARDRAARLDRRVRSLDRAVSASSAERDRIKAERDRLEARLAAQTAPPKVCPEETLSTAKAHLLARFSVDYPCGWNVLEDPLQSFPQDPKRKGLMLDQLFLSALPISMAPREGPVSEITVDTWSDDPNVEGDALPVFADWLSTAKKRFTSVSETTVRTGAGLGVARLQGSMTSFDEPRPALLYVWEWTDPDGARRISEAFSLDPGPIVTRTLASLIRSFRVLGS